MVDVVIGCDGVNGVFWKVVLGEIVLEVVVLIYCNMYIYWGIVFMLDVKVIFGEYGGDFKRFMGR